MRDVLAPLSFVAVLSGCAQDHYLSNSVTEDQPVYVEVPVETEYDLWVDSFTQSDAVNGTDVLWVIDYSGSMTNDQERIASGIASMMSVLPDYGWKIHVVPMSPDKAAEVDQIPLEPGDDVYDALTLVNHVDQWGVGDEQGMDSVVEFVTNNPHAWLSPDAAMLVVFVSDEDDMSWIAPDMFSDWLSRTRPTSVVTSIVGREPVTCAYPGDRYIEAASLTGGVDVDFCSNDWSYGIQESVFNVQPKDHIVLSHTPSDLDSMEVFFDGEVQEWGWRYDSRQNAVYFDILPDGGALVEVVYAYEG
jgi:hypothetical protein